MGPLYTEQLHSSGSRAVKDRSGPGQGRRPAVAGIQAGHDGSRGVAEGGVRGGAAAAHLEKHPRLRQWQHWPTPTSHSDGSQRASWAADLPARLRLLPVFHGPPRKQLHRGRGWARAVLLLHVSAWMSVRGRAATTPDSTCSPVAEATPSWLAQVGGEAFGAEEHAVQACPGTAFFVRTIDE